MTVNGSKLTIVVPAYNEAENLSSFLPELIDYCLTNNWEIILVNDGSTDNTKELLDSFIHYPILKVIHHKLNRGYGGALKSGILESNTEFLITIDADGQHNPEDISELYKVMVKNDADMVIGSRETSISMSLSRSIGKWLIRTLARILFSIKIHDLNSGMKIYRTDLLKSTLSFCPDSMAFSDTITLAFINKRYLVLEHPIKIGQRSKGKSTVRVHTAFQTVMEIINIVMLFNPMKIFLPISIFFFTAGSIWALPFLLQGRGLSVLSGIFIVVGILIFLIGLLAEQLATLKQHSK